MKNTKEEMKTIRIINEMLLKKVDMLSRELAMETELHFNTVTELLEVSSFLEELDNLKKPF